MLRQAKHLFSPSVSEKVALCGAEKLLLFELNWIAWTTRRCVQRKRKYSICMNHNPQGRVKVSFISRCNAFPFIASMKTLESNCWRRGQCCCGSAVFCRRPPARVDGVNAEIDSPPPLVCTLCSSSWFLIPPVKVHFGAKCRQPKRRAALSEKQPSAHPVKKKRSHARKVWWPSPASLYRHCNKVKWVAD